ncbi:MAG: YdcF family protein [Pseudomonadales bacterium]
MLDKVVISVISPLGSALLGFLVAFLLARVGFKRLGRLLAVFSFLWLYIWSTPVASSWILAYVESQYALVEFDDIPVADAAVVLGGGVVATGFSESTLQDINLGNSADRVWYASRLYHAGKVKRLILTGGTPLGGGGLSEAEAMQVFAQSLGVPSVHIHLESASNNTRENAHFTGDIIREHHYRRVLLVTSAFHMGRAIGRFDALGLDSGLELIPVPTDFESALLRQQYCCLPGAYALNVSAKVFKEIVARVAL